MQLSGESTSARGNALGKGPRLERAWRDTVGSGESRERAGHRGTGVGGGEGTAPRALLAMAKTLALILSEPESRWRVLGRGGMWPHNLSFSLQFHQGWKQGDR